MSINICIHKCINIYTECRVGVIISRDCFAKLRIIARYLREKASLVLCQIIKMNTFNIVTIKKNLVFAIHYLHERDILSWRLSSKWNYICPLDASHLLHYIGISVNQTMRYELSRVISYIEDGRSDRRLRVIPHLAPRWRLSIWRFAYHKTHGIRVIQIYATFSVSR